MGWNRGINSSAFITSFRYNRQNVFTFLFYVLPDKTVTELHRLTQQSFIEAYGRQSKLKKQKGAIHEGAVHANNLQDAELSLTLVLSCANTVAKRAKRKGTVGRHPDVLLMVDTDAGDAARAVFHLRKFDRSVFVLCAILRLEPREAGRVLKLPPVSVARILARALKAFWSEFHGDAGEIDSSQSEGSDQEWTLDTIFPPSIGSKMKVNSDQLSGVSERDLRAAVLRFIQIHKRRRYIFLASSVSVAIVVLVGLVWSIESWQYAQNPVPVALSPKVKSFYAQQVGFAPRLPSNLPKAMKSAPSEVSIGTAESNFSISFEDDSTRVMIGIDETKAVNPPPLSHQSDSLQQVLYVHGVRVALQGTTNYYTVNFDVSGVHCTVTIQWPAFTNGFSKAAVLSLVETMITHPAEVDTLPVYQDRVYYGPAALRAPLGFQPVLWTGTGLQDLSSSPSTVDVNIQSRGAEHFEVFSALYRGVRQQVHLREYWGSIIELGGGSQKASQDYAPVQKLLHIDGHSVRLRPDNMGLYWYDAKTGVGFEVVGQPQSEAELVSIMKNLMKQVKGR